MTRYLRIPFLFVIEIFYNLWHSIDGDIMKLKKEVEKSCGIIPYTIKDGHIYYLLIKQTNNVICFPKGHVEENETEKETALRECMEETNVKASIIDGFRDSMTYYMEEYDKYKNVVYFVGKIINFDMIKQDKEIEAIKMLNYEEALNALEYQNLKDVLIKANDFILSLEFVVNKKIQLSDYDIELHLVRHGNYNLNKVGGWTDDSLSLEGILEANHLKDLVDDHYDLFISSDLIRAKETANIINQKLHMDIIFNESFREINSGRLNDITIEELKKNPSLWVDFYSLGIKDKFPQGESPLDLYNRVSEAFINLITHNRGKKILLVSHSGVIGVILCMLNGYPYHHTLQISPKVGTITKLK